MGWPCPQLLPVPEAPTMVCAGAQPPSGGRGGFLGPLKPVRVGLWAPSRVWVSALLWVVGRTASLWQRDTARVIGGCFSGAWVFCCIRPLLGVPSLALL